MAKLLKLRRGTTTQHGSFTGAEGEVTIDTTKDTAVVHDGAQAGGRPLAREDMSNVSSASIAGQLGTDSIATTKIAAGALPTDVTVASANIVDGTIVNADVNASAAIAGTKIAPDFGSQNISTTGNITTTGKVLFANVYSNESDLPSASTYHGMFAHVHATGLAYYAHNGSWHKLAKNDAPDFTGGIDVTGNITSTGSIGSTGNISVTNESPNISFVDSGDNPDYQVGNENGLFRIRDTSGGGNRLTIASGGDTTVSGNFNASSGVDVTGNITTTSGNLTVDGIGSVEDTFKITDSAGTQYLLMGNQDSAGANSPRVFSVGNASLTIGVGDSWSSNTGGTLTNHFGIAKNGTITSYGNHDFSAGVDVTGNITVTGTVDGRDVAADGTKLDGIESGATADQTASEIVSLVSGQALAPSSVSATNVFATNQLGRDSTDHLVFTDNNRMDVVLNGSNEFRFEMDGDFHADGDVYAFSTTTASDENLKENIVTVTDAVAKVEGLKGVTFKWKENDAVSAGVIAQDVEKVLPEVVKTVANNDGNEYKAVNYGGLTSILIEAIKDLSARVKVLEAK